MALLIFALCVMFLLAISATLPALMLSSQISRREEAAIEKGQNEKTL